MVRCNPSTGAILGTPMLSSPHLLHVMHGSGCNTSFQINQLSPSTPTHSNCLQRWTQMCRGYLKSFCLVVAITPGQAPICFTSTDQKSCHQQCFSRLLLVLIPCWWPMAMAVLIRESTTVTILDLPNVGNRWRLPFVQATHYRMLHLLYRYTTFSFTYFDGTSSVLWQMRLQYLYTPDSCNHWVPIRSLRLPMPTVRLPWSVVGQRHQCLNAVPAL